MEREQIKEVLDLNLGKNSYTIPVYLLSAPYQRGTTNELIEVQMNTFHDHYVSDKKAKAIGDDLYKRLMDKYQHDDVYVVASNVFNTLVVITISY